MSSLFEINKYHITDDDKIVNEIVIVKYKMRFITKSSLLHIIQRDQKLCNFWRLYHMRNF